jgi:hypothetical protein
METIKKLIAQEGDLTRLLAEVREQLWQERIRYAAEEYGVKPGSIVKDDSGNLYRVIAPHREFVFPAGKPELVVTRQKKNGDFSKQVQTILFWELVE